MWRALLDDDSISVTISRPFECDENYITFLYLTKWLNESSMANVSIHFLVLPEMILISLKLKFWAKSRTC